MNFLERGDVDARIAQGVHAERAMAGQSVMPAKEYKPRLRFRAEQPGQHGRDDERHADREQVLRVSEDGAQPVNFDRVRLDHAIEKERIHRDDDPELPAISGPSAIFRASAARRRLRTARVNHSPRPAWRTAAWKADRSPAAAGSRPSKQS